MAGLVASCSFFPLFGSYIYALLTDEASIRQAATSVLEHFLADGVVYLELRTTPRAAGRLTAEDHVRLLLDVVARFEAAHADAMHTRLILSVDRRHDLHMARSVAALAARLRSEAGVGVVGLDLCGDPTARPAGAVDLFTPLFEPASRRGLGLTVHFAEAEASASPEELRTLLAWRPDRLGHVIWEDDESRREIARRGLCLELCLSCNVKAGMIRGGFESHHLKHWMAVDGPKISLGVSLQAPSEDPSPARTLTAATRRPTTWVSLAAPSPTSTASSHSTSASTAPASAPSPASPSTPYSEATGRSSGCGTSCGLEPLCDQRRATPTRNMAMKEAGIHFMYIGSRNRAGLASI